MAGSICPFCEQPLGKEYNRFRYDMVNFSISDPSEDQSGAIKERLEQICAIYCENCNKVVGVSN